MFTTNPEYWSHNEFYPGTRTQSEGPVGSFEGHVSYNFKPRLWVSLDGNFWFGGRIMINGIENGQGVSIPVEDHDQSEIPYVADSPVPVDVPGSIWFNFFLRIIATKNRPADNSPESAIRATEPFLVRDWYDYVQVADDEEVV